ncbi:rhomboid family intramembrane serine protease [Sphingomonas sp. GCM10030256]|uniref:rhomboid family intramembrane serine protease n=1 Tax=Sphingomonas sp. GCM10030256 TaxID=3273427 RepID=UPI003622673B
MKRPSTTVILTAVTSFVSLMIMAAGLDGQAAGAMGLVPARLSGQLDLVGAVPAWLTPFSCTLVHGGILHLFFNMLMLVWCGTAVERLLGTPGMLTIYGVSAIVSALAQWMSAPLELSPVIGASGAVSGLIGAYALSFGRPRMLVQSPRFNRFLHVVWLAAAWAVLQLAVGFVAGAEGLLLATPAHIGGFVAGLLLQRPLLLWRYRGA